MFRDRWARRALLAPPDPLAPWDPRETRACRARLVPLAEVASALLVRRVLLAPSVRLVLLAPSVRLARTAPPGLPVPLVRLVGAACVV